LIRLNAFITIKPYFKIFNVIRAPLAGDACSCSQLTKMLFDNEVAYAFSHEGYLYFKGDLDETLRTAEKTMTQGITRGNSMLGSPLERLRLTISDSAVIKPIVYLAFEKLLESRGFKIPKRRVKKAIPEINVEANRKRGLITPLTDDIVVLRGLKYMLEIRPSGYGALWLDVYSPPLSLQNMRLLSPKEVRYLGLMELYYYKAILKSIDRLNVLYNIIDILCDGTRTLTVKFPDGDSIQFSMELLQLQAVEGEW